MKKINKRAAMLLTASLALGGFMNSALAAEEKLASYKLGDVVVEAERDTLPGGMLSRTTRMGISGERNIMDVPYSEQSMTEKTIETFGDAGQPLANVLLNNPSIRSSTSSPMYTDFSMRGINMNGNHFMLNGVPSLFYQFTTPPSHIIERMDITSGPNAGVNGVNMSNNGTNSGATPAPGTINVITKRATDEPITKYRQTFSGRSSLGEYIDIGRRFGKDNEWGLRVNGEHLQGTLSLPGTENNSKNIFVNLDHKDKNSSTNLFFGYWDLRVNEGQRWFTYGGNGKTLPKAPKSKTRYDFPETTKWMYMHVLTLNHEQKIDDRWKVFFNGGFSKRDGNKFNSGASLRFDTAGNFTGNNRSNAQDEAGRNSYLQLGVSGELETGAVKHQVTLAVDRSWAKYWNANAYGATGLYGGNIYNGIIFGAGFYPLPAMPTASAQWEETNVGITLMDILSYKKWGVMLGASQKHEHLEYLTNGKIIRNDNILPTYGVTYKPTDNVSVYYGHTESFSRGYIVTNSTYKNVGEIMEPVKSRQNEIGVKYENAGVLNTLSLFSIDEANRFDYIDSLGDKWYKADGKNNYKGIEWTANGKIGGKLSVTGGLLYLNAKRDKTQGGTKDGWFVNGAAKWSGVMGLVYEPTDKFSIIGRSVWTGRSYIDSSAVGGKTEIPSALTFDLGVKYKTKLNTVPVDLSLMCFNVTNKDYWMGRGGSTTFGLSMPRTIMLSADFSL